MFAAPLKTGAAIAAQVAEILRPPARITPTQACEGKLRNDRDTWHAIATPYLIDPLDDFASRMCQGIVFVGPARTGKTFGLIIGGINYIVTVSPADILCIYMSQDTARQFSRMEVDRAIQNTAELAARMSPRSRDDNTYDKFFRIGMSLVIGWPSATQLRGKTVKYCLLADYDGSKSIDVGGRGSLWGQAFKRIQTYQSRGKCLAESSPGIEYDDAEWSPRTPHEAPPAKGIAEIYNSGTRARWYWHCLHCREPFESKPGIDIFAVPEFDELVELVKRRGDLMAHADEFARVPCPHCGALHLPADKAALNRIRTEGDRIRGAAWLHDGERLVDGIVEGERRRSNIRSYWLSGAAAAYQDWRSLMHRYLLGVQKYASTGDETGLKESSHDDQAWPYLPRSIRKRRSLEGLEGRLEDWPQGIVPSGVRFITNTIDVQAHRFVVHVIGWGVGLESWLIDRFSITASNRPEGDKFAAIDPAVFVEDWQILTERVLERRYELAGTDLVMRAAVTGCDSGGKEGVTLKAYDYYRTLRRENRHGAFHLLKGTGNLNAPRTARTFPDSRGRKDREGGRGDVPVVMLNVNVIKDGVAGDLARDTPGPGYCHLPEWIDDGFFEELKAETRTAKGWEREGKQPNEAFDLHTYARGLCVLIGAESINWDAPPSWAAEWDRNTLVTRVDGNPVVKPAVGRGRKVRHRGFR